MKGRPRKPTALHHLQGTARNDRINPDEPQFPVDRPEKPAAIEGRALASEEWDRIVPILLDQRVLSPAYRSALVGYCLSYADMLEGKKDGMKEHRQWASQLGLTPVTTAKVKKAQPTHAEPTSPLARLQAKRAASKLHAVK